MSPEGLAPELDALARLAGVLPEYRAYDGRTIHVEAETVLAVLGALGVVVSHPKDAAAALVEAREARSRRLLEPVVVHRGGAPTVMLGASVAHAPASWSLTITCEDGRTKRAGLPELIVGPHQGGGVLARVPTTDGSALGPGYHELVLEGPAVVARALLVSAPRCPVPRRGWGVFMPLYALRSASDWGAGSYVDLAALGRWTASVGGDFLGMLPLYPAFLDPPCDPSPYLPVTRLALNELYVDPAAVPELEAAPSARRLLSSGPFAARVVATHRAVSVPYEELVRSGRGEAELRGFAEVRPDLLAYARFRATGERHGRDWHSWPASAARECGALPFSDPAVLYHLCAQWLAHRQLADASGAIPIYGDLPVGVHPQGFDPYFEPEAFAGGVQGGAPPDAFYAGGQAWALPPLHPVGIRAQGYRHLIAVLRSAFAHLGALRIDHVMGLHRMYWIPEGHDARHGAYVSYRAEELRAIVALEAHRAGAVVVGEDLGTVDESVREAMAEDRMLRTWVFEFATSRSDPLPEPPAQCIASIGSHDVPRFAAFWRGAAPGEPNDTDELVAGRIENARALERRAWREALSRALGVEPEASGASHETLERSALGGVLEHLAAGPAALVLVDLQDLWGELEQENRPGTGSGAGNWRHRSALELEQLVGDPGVGALCSLVERRRAERVEAATP